MTNLPTIFAVNPSSRFWDVLLSNQQTNIQTDWRQNPIPSGGVKMSTEWQKEHPERSQVRSVAAWGPLHGMEKMFVSLERQKEGDRERNCYALHHRQVHYRCPGTQCWIGTWSICRATAGMQRTPSFPKQSSWVSLCHVVWAPVSIYIYRNTKTSDTALKKRDR